MEIEKIGNVYREKSRFKGSGLFLFLFGVAIGVALVLAYINV